MKLKNSKFVLPYAYNEDGLHASRAYIENRFKTIRPYIRPHLKILELGCGEGLLGARILQIGDVDMYGIDASSSGVARSKRRGIHARLADLNEAFPYRDSSFDIIFSDQVLEHVLRTDHLLDETYRVLKPGGIVITITPNLSFWLNRVLFLFGFYPLFLEASENTKVYGLKLLKRLVKDTNSMGHVRVFNKGALRDIFLAHRYHIQKIEGSPLTWNLPSPLKQIYDHADRFFSLFPSLARDLVLVAKKSQTKRG